MRSDKQDVARDSQRERLHDTTVPKELRNNALQLARTVKDSSMRADAQRWVKASMRTRSDLESFVIRMGGHIEL